MTAMDTDDPRRIRKMQPAGGCTQFCEEDDCHLIGPLRGLIAGYGAYMCDGHYRNWNTVYKRAAECWGEA